MLGRHDLVVRNVMSDGAWRTNRPRPAQYLRDISKDLPFFAMFGGNYHNVFGLTEHPVPFDFVLPSRERLGAEPGRTLVPYHILRARFENELAARVLRMTKNYCALFTGAVHCVLPPPPIPDNQFVLDHAGPYFRSTIARGVSPPGIRIKLYDLCCQVCSDFYRAEGITVVPPPKEAVDEEGFLERRYWRNDATHANAAYGELVLRQIDSLNGGERGASIPEQT